MASVFDKLNLKDGGDLVVLDAPFSFEPELRALRGVNVSRAVSAAEHVVFVLAFVTRKSQVDRQSKVLASKATGDAILWFAYPKATSKQFTCDFNRDNGWDVIRTAGWDSVRQVAIDADWSALRFRRKEFIKQRS